MLLQGLLKRSLIADIAIDHGNGASSDLLHAADGFRMAVAEVVENHDFMAVADQFDGCMAADIAGAACEQSFHKLQSSFVK
jgi:hypothetical protein